MRFHSNIDMSVINLPVKTLPPKKRVLSSGSTLSVTPNTTFVGRESELINLAKLINQISSEGAFPQVIVVTGFAGVGKTQFITEFVFRYGQYFEGGVFWVNFEEETSIPVEIASCGGELGMNLDDFDWLPNSEQVERVKEAWEENIPRLLIFDNCKDEKLLEKWCPKKGSAQAITTSRKGEWDIYTTNASILQLGVFEPHESVELLRKTLQIHDSTTDATLKAIAAELGNLPLAVNLIGRFLRYHRHTILPGQLLNELQQQNPIDHRALSSHELSQIFRLSLENLDLGRKVDLAAMNLLVQAAYLVSGEPIPQHLLRIAKNGKHFRTSKYKHNKKDEDQYDPYLTQDGLNRLINLGLLESRTDNSLYLHRLLSVFINTRYSNLEAKKAIEEALLDIINLYSSKKELMQGLNLLHNNLRYVTKDINKHSNNIARVGGWLGYYLYQIGDYISAIALYTYILEIAETSLKSEHPRCIIFWLNYKGALLRFIGNLNEAKSIYKEVVVLAESVLGANHPKTISALGNLGTVFRDMNDLDNAIFYANTALTRATVVYGSKHPDTISRLNEMGYLLQTNGEFIEATKYYRQAYNLTKEIRGASHPNLIVYLSHLGSLHEELKQFNKARKYFQLALEIQEEIFGVEHYTVIESLRSVGAMFKRSKEYQKAYIYYRRALHICEITYGAKHVETFLSMNDMAYLSWQMKDYKLAHMYYDHLLYCHEKTLGLGHQDTIDSINSFGTFLQAIGKMEDAKKLYLSKLNSLENTLNANSHFLLSIRSKLNTLGL